MKISAETDYSQWIDLFHSAEGDMITAILKLLKLQGMDFEEIRGIFTVHLYRQCKFQKEK